MARYSIFFTFVIVFCFAACKKDKGITDEPQNSTSPLPITASFSVSNVICYPYDTTSASLQIIIGGGQAPYNIEWDNNTLSGAGPFSFLFKTNSSHTVNVTDANNVFSTFHYSVQRNQFDSLTYDYRNDLIGEYTGLMSTSYIPVPSTVTIVNPPYTYSTSIVKHYLDFRKIGIQSTTIGYYYDRAQKKFTDGLNKVFGRFSNDSLYYSGQAGMSPSWYAFKGKKTN